MKDRFRRESFNRLNPSSYCIYCQFLHSKFDILPTEFTFVLKVSQNKHQIFPIEPSMIGFVKEMRRIYCSVGTDYVSSLKVKVPKTELCRLSISAASKFETCMGDGVKQIRTLIRNKLNLTGNMDYILSANCLIVCVCFFT